MKAVKIKAACLCLLLALLPACRKSPPPAVPSIQIAVPYEIDTLDPHARARRSNFAIAFNFYEPLVRTSANMKIEPCLAKDWENPDTYTWVFHLQPSVRFHDGSLLTADDVKFSLERILHNPELEVSANLPFVSEVSAVDEHTVRIRTSAPVNVFLNKLSFVTIISKGSTNEFLASHVNGTGPYKLKEWKKGQMIRMEKNGQYWGKAPEIQFVDFRLNRTADQAVEDLISGQCQLVQANSKKLEEKIDSEKYRVIVHDSQFVKYLSYDLFRETTPYCTTKTNPFRNPLVRQALHMGINREELVQRLPSYALPATQPVPPFVFGYNPKLTPPVYDPKKARELLASAGFPNGFEVTLLSRQISEDAGVIVGQQLANIGLQVKLKVLPDVEYFDALHKKDFSFILNRLASTIGDCSDILEGALHSVDAGRHYGSQNYAEYTNPDIDNSIEQSAAIMKEEERRNVLEGIMEKLMTDLPWIPLFIDQEVYGVDKKISWQPRHDALILAAEIKMAQ